MKKCKKKTFNHILSTPYWNQVLQICPYKKVFASSYISITHSRNMRHTCLYIHTQKHSVTECQMFVLRWCGVKQVRFYKGVRRCQITLCLYCSWLTFLPTVNICCNHENLTSLNSVNYKTPILLNPFLLNKVVNEHLESTFNVLQKAGSVFFYEQSFKKTNWFTTRTNNFL